jgi:sucrose-6F-phosphate phosphohydrolase
MTVPIQHLLISDLDDTLLGDDAALNEFAARVAQWPGFVLAYASGRSCASIRKSVETTGLPAPLALMGSMGTVIEHYPGTEAFGDWPEARAERWAADGVRSALEQAGRLTLQPESEQATFKVSYFCPDATEDELQRYLEMLTEAAIDANYIYSSRRDLDFLPAGVDKGTAAAYLADALNVPANLVFVAGNSANDTALFNHGFNGIVVGNAHDELKDHGRQRDAYLATRSHAAGVLEGIEYHLKHGA